MTAPFADRHAQLWDWVDALQPGTRPRPFVALWARGSGKSTTAELACARVGARRSRRYIWYVSRTQDKADKHVEAIASLLESRRLELEDPLLASRKVGKYGHSKGWRRERLRTASGLTVDALGLDTGARGAKVDDARPGLIVLDDIDEKHDTPAATKKLIETITTSLLPAGSADCAILFIQNVIHDHSIAAQLSDNRADWLLDRFVSGPFPAVKNLTYESYYDETLSRARYRVTSGAATWEGQSLATCEQQLNDWGPTAFLQEAQHEVDALGGIWNNVTYRRCKRDEVPDLVDVCCWTDPAVTSTDNSDSNGIQIDGLAKDGTIYRLFSWEGIDTPEAVLRRAMLAALEYGARRLGVETDQGGDTWWSVYMRVVEYLAVENPPTFAQNKAGAGHGSKIERNARMLADYEFGRVVHVEGTHDILERALRRFPKKPLDLADGAYWAWEDLRGSGWAWGMGR